MSLGEASAVLLEGTSRSNPPLAQLRQRSNGESSGAELYLQGQPGRRIPLRIGHTVK